MRLELASLFTNVVLLITLYTFILGLINSDFFALRFDPENYYLFSKLIEAATLLMVLKIIVNSSLEWKHFGLTTLGARNSIIESILVSVAVMALLYWAKLILMRYYPASFAGEEVIDFSYFDWTYITYLVVAPLQEFITRGVVQSTLQRLLVRTLQLVVGNRYYLAAVWILAPVLITIFGIGCVSIQLALGVDVSPPPKPYRCEHIPFSDWQFCGVVGLWAYF